MDFAQEPIFQWMSQFAYEPTMVYVGLVGMMLLSSVGFPLPEEVTLVSVGVLAFMGANPEHFPPPFRLHTCSKSMTTGSAFRTLSLECSFHGVLGKKLGG